MKTTLTAKRLSAAFPALLVCFLLLATSGCRPDHAAKVAESTRNSTGNPAVPYARIDPATAGTVTGTISFVGKAPERVKIDMSQDPACGMTSAGDNNYSEQYVIHDGKLANVFVSVKRGLNGAVYAPPTMPVILDQKGCQYTPHVIGVMAGQPAEFRNSDPTMHNIHTMPIEVVGVEGNKELDISQAPMGAPQQAMFRHPETMMAVRCNNHPWMNAFINVTDSPFYAVSDAAGHFEIKGLPPGTYTISALHEKLGEQTATVTVGPLGTSLANFTFVK